jgi:hypothetical protein
MEEMFRPSLRLHKYATISQLRGSGAGVYKTTASNNRWDTFQPTIGQCWPPSLIKVGALVHCILLQGWNVAQLVVGAK